MFIKYTKKEAYNILLQGSNSIYCKEKIEKRNIKLEDVAYMAPEQLPTIASDQVKTLLFMMVEILSISKEDTDYIIDKIQNGYLFNNTDGRL